MPVFKVCMHTNLIAITTSEHASIHDELFILSLDVQATNSNQLSVSLIFTTVYSTKFWQGKLWQIC